MARDWDLLRVGEGIMANICNQDCMEELGNAELSGSWPRASDQLKRFVVCIYFIGGKRERITPSFILVFRRNLHNFILPVFISGLDIWGYI